MTTSRDRATRRYVRVTLLSLLVLAPFSFVEKAQAGRPCCAITNVERASGLVTARETATGRMFQFEVDSRKLLKSLKVGQSIWVDQGTQKVSVDGIAPCCAIVGPANVSTADLPQPDAVAPCCAITNVERASGLVSARETATGRTFQFKPTDAKLLNSLQPGQTVFADFGTQKVSVDGGIPCCEMVQAATVEAPTLPVVHGIIPCCSIVANPAMKGRMGKLIFAFPAGSNVSETYIAVFKPGQPQDLMHWYGAKTVDLIPGAYAVTINGKRVENVTVRSGHDTRVRVGVLRVNAGSETYVQVMGADKKEALHFYGKRDVGLPAGALDVIIAGQSDTVAITDGAITEF